MTDIHRVLDHLRRTVLVSGIASQSDAQLLDRYIADKDEVAFAALLSRHGPMVMGVCRRMLGNAAEAEDAFQAAFLVLVRRASAVTPREMVGNWLYGVAYHTARKAREAAAQRQRHEHEAGSRPRTTAGDGLGQLRELLDLGLRALPERYRAAVVLCDLEGKSRKEAAAQLGWAEGTVASRLSRGRDLLARRLKGWGLTCSASALAAVLTEGAALARVPAPLMSSTLKAAVIYASGGAAAGTVPAGALALTEGVLQAMWMTKLKMTAAVLLIGVASASILGPWSIATGQAPPTSTTVAAPTTPAPAAAAEAHDRLVAALTALLKDANADVRRKTIEVLAEKDAVNVLKALRQALADADPTVRARATEAVLALAKDPVADAAADAERAKIKAALDAHVRAIEAAKLKLNSNAVAGEERLVFAPNGNTLAIIRGNRALFVSMANGKEQHSFGLEDRITSLGFSPQGEMVVIGTANRKVRAYGLARETAGKLIWERDE